MSAHDRWLAGYRHEVVEVYCQNPECVHADGIEADYEVEYGQGSLVPEECPLCHCALDFTKPEEDEDA
jgi:hypothetical protein